MTKRGWALFVAVGVIWGIPYLLIKVAVVGGLTPATLVLLRTSIGALLLLPLVAFRGDIRPLFPRWKTILAYTAVEVTVPWFLLADAEQHISSSLTGLLIAAVPLIGAVLALLPGGEARPDARRVGGLVVGFIGVAVLLGLDVSTRDLGAAGELGLVTVCYAIGPMIVARRLSDVPASGVVAASLVVTALVYAPVGLAQMPHSLPSARVLGAVVILAAVCTSLAFLLFFALIAEVGAVRAQVITYINPAVALALGVALLGEPFTVGKAVGFALILVGLFLATRRRPVAARALAQSRDAPSSDAAAS